MAFVLADRVKETSTTNGTGSYELAGAPTGSQTFVAGIGDDNTTLYFASDGTNWETGLGTVNDGTPDTLARTRIFESSNADAAVNWAGGTTKTIVCGLPALSATRVGLPRGYLAGLGLANNGTDANNDIDIAAGQCRAESWVDAGYIDEDLRLTATLTKRLDAAWAVGTGNGGIDTGSKAVSTTYHVHLIQRVDTGVVDALFSTSATAPTMPANYTKRRRIGAVITDASGNILAFSQRGDEFLLLAAVADFATGAQGTTAVLRALTVPAGIKVTALIGVHIANTGVIGYITSPDQNDETAVNTGRSALRADTSASDAGYFAIRTNTSRQIRTVANQAATTINGSTFGWIDRRGRDD